MTGLDPGYGETPLPFDELDALLRAARDVLPDPPTKADVYDLEQSFELVAREQLIHAVLNETLTIDELLTAHFVQQLHGRLYGELWTWAGTWRRVGLNIGVEPRQILMELHGGLDSVKYHAQDWSAHRLGIAVHAEVVRIHPFVDGNGRSTRLLGDLVFLAAQAADEPVAVYDWDLGDKRTYIDALRRYDGHRDPTELAALIGAQQIDG